MAGRINRNRLLRKIHFVTSILIFAFALLFVFTGLIMSKGNLFPHGKAQVTTKVLPLNYTPDTTRMDLFGAEIKERFEIRGRMNYKRNWKNELVFNYYRPMVSNVVTVAPALDSLTVVRKEIYTFLEANTRIHRVHGYEGRALYIIWAVLVDLTAIAMIVFVITGFLIWFRRRRQWFYGWFIMVPTFILLLVMYFFLK